MGLFDRLKHAVFGGKPALPLTTAQIAAGMAAQGQSYIIQNLDPSIRSGFDNVTRALQDIGSMFIVELHKSEERIIQHIDGVLQNPAMTAEEKIKTLKENIIFTPKLDNIISLMKNTGIVTPTSLADLLNIKPPTAHEHLIRLVKLGMVQEIYRGSYKLKGADIAIVETPKENDSAKTEAQDASAETEQPA